MFFVNEFDNISLSEFESERGVSFDASDVGESSLGKVFIVAFWFFVDIRRFPTMTNTFEDDFSSLGLKLPRLRQVSFNLFSYTSDKLLNIYFQVTFNLTGRSEDVLYEGREEYSCRVGLPGSDST